MSEGTHIEAILSAVYTAELQAVHWVLAGSSIYCRITSCTFEPGWQLNVQLNILSAVNNQLVVQYTAELLAVHWLLAGSSSNC